MGFSTIQWTTRSSLHWQISAVFRQFLKSIYCCKWQNCTQTKLSIQQYLSTQLLVHSLTVIMSLEPNAGQCIHCHYCYRYHLVLTHHWHHQVPCIYPFQKTHPCLCRKQYLDSGYCEYKVFQTTSYCNPVKCHMRTQLPTSNRPLPVLLWGDIAASAFHSSEHQCVKCEDIRWHPSYLILDFHHVLNMCHPLFEAFKVVNWPVSSTRQL